MFKRIIALILALTVVIGVTSCGKSGPEKEIDNTVAVYMNAMKNGMYTDAAQVVDGNDILLASPDINENTLELAQACIKRTEYSVSNVVVSGSEATGLLTITTVDVQRAFERADFQDFVGVLAALNTSPATVSQSFALNFKYTDKWYIASTIAIEQYYISLVEDMNLYSLSKSEAVDLINSIMDEYCAGNLDTAYSISSYASEDYNSFDEFFTESGFPECVRGYLSADLLNSTYTAEVTYTTAEYVDINVVVTSTNMDEIFNNAFIEDEAMQAYAHYLYDTNNPYYFVDYIVEKFCTNAIEYMDSTSETMETVIEFRVRIDENGNYTYEVMSPLDWVKINAINMLPGIVTSLDPNYYLIPATEYANSIRLITDEECAEIVDSFVPVISEEEVTEEELDYITEADDEEQDGNN